MAVITRSHIQWTLAYQGEPMLSPVFESYEQCVDYINRAPVEQRDDYVILSRIVVTQTSSWAEWK